MAFENSPYDVPALIAVRDRQWAIAQTYRELVRRPVYLATATTGCDFWSQRSEELLEICILESDGRVLFESLVKPRDSISIGAYQVHRITKRMVKDAPTWNQILPQVSRALGGRRVAPYDAKRQLRLLKQSNALYDVTWSVEEGRVFCVKQLFARFLGKEYAGGLNSTWLGLWRAARNFGIVHGKWLRAREDAQITRAVLKQMASHYFVRPPGTPLPRPFPLRRWIAELFRR
jgi:DNA polymerase-3 subunit epsilon